MADFFTELLKVIGTPTRARLVALLFLLAFAVGGLAFYERFTASFRLGRLEKQTALLTQLRELQLQQATNSSPELEKARLALVEQVVRVVEEKPISLEFVPSKLTMSYDSLKKFIAGAVFWFLFSLIFINKIKTKEGKDNFRACIVLGVITGFAGLFVPPILWPWFHLLIFPWLWLVAITIGLIPFLLVFANFRTARKTAQKNTCINNLRLIDSAKQQWMLENLKKDTDIPTIEELTPYVGRVGSEFPRCPAGGKYEVGNVGAPPKCSIAGHSLQPPSAS